MSNTSKRRKRKKIANASKLRRHKAVRNPSSGLRKKYVEASKKRNRASAAPKLRRQRAVSNLSASAGLQQRPTAVPAKGDQAGGPPQLRRQQAVAPAPGRRRANAVTQDQRRESRAANATNVPNVKTAAEGLSPKQDKWYKGRNLYPTEGADGKTTYLPQRSDATPSELLKGQFVKDVDTGREATAGTPPRKDRARGRNLYATKDDDGNTVYLPQKSDATPRELLKGQFVKDVDRGKDALDGKPPKRDHWYKGRNLYATEGDDGKTIYLPQQSEATPSELLKGQFVKDVNAGKDVVDGDGLSPKSDRWYRGRNLYPTRDEDGSIIYLPQKSDATPRERLKGRYVKDEHPGKDSLDGYAPKEDKARGRNLYAAKGDDGEVIYLPQESEATPSELQKGQFVEDLDLGKNVIEVLPGNTKPKKDGSRVDKKGRLLYPVEVPSETEGEKNKIEYYPKESEATEVEKEKGEFIRDEEVKNDEEMKRRAERANRHAGRSRSNAIVSK